MNKYQNGKIYKLVCDNSPLVYYGSTIETLSTRLSKHKYNHKNKTGCGSSELFDLGKVSIHEIEEYPCNSKKELESYERIYIEFILKNFDYKIICNKSIPCRTQKEYRLENNEDLRSKANEKFICPCGGKYTRSHKLQHFKSKKHINYVNGL